MGLIVFALFAPADMGREGHAYAGCEDDGQVGLVEVDAHGRVACDDAFVPGGAPRAAPGAAALASHGSPPAGSDNYDTGRAR